jgi:glucose-1-phosphate cytidylyltransferase
MKTVILCGGKGTRAYPHTEKLPKPLLEVAGRPILRHVMEIFASHGHQEFVLATGYLGNQIASFAKDLPSDWKVDLLDTGENAGTGSRLAQCRFVAGDRFFATYGDGVADVDLSQLLRFHIRSRGLATVTTVPLPSPYGTLQFADGDRVVAFKEKPVLDDHWINAGFFVFEAAAFDSASGEDLEREVLPALAERGSLYAYRHRGFWASMDTYKDALNLSALCDGSTPPWLQAGRLRS